MENALFYSSQSPDTALYHFAEEHRKLSHAVEQSPCSIVITDTRGQIEYVNPKFTEITGYAADEVIGQNPRILKSGETSPEEYRKLWQNISSGKLWRGEFHNRRKNGEYYWENASISPIRDKTGTITHYIAIKEDITLQKELEAQLRKTEKDRVMAQTAAAAAHEIYQPLTVIMGMTQLLEGLLPENSSYHEHLHTILQAGEKVKKIVDQMGRLKSYTTCPYAGKEHIVDFESSTQPSPETK